MASGDCGPFLGLARSGTGSLQSFWRGPLALPLVGPAHDHDVCAIDACRSAVARDSGRQQPAGGRLHRRHNWGHPLRPPQPRPRRSARGRPTGPNPRRCLGYFGARFVRSALLSRPPRPQRSSEEERSRRHHQDDQQDASSLRCRYAGNRGRLAADGGGTTVHRQAQLPPGELSFRRACRGKEPKGVPHVRLQGPRSHRHRCGW